MKKLRTTLCTLTLVVAGSIASFAQNADEIIQKHITAIGGAEAWKKVNSIKMTGSMNAQGTEIGVTQTVAHNKGMRQDISVMGMNGYMIVTNKEGWSFMPFGGQTAPEAMTPDQVKESQDELDIQGDLIDYQAKGNKVEFVGKDDVEGTEVFKLKVTGKDGKEKTVYIDASSYFMIREVRKINADGKEMEMAIDFSNFQKQANGTMFPMTVGTPQGEVNFSKVEINSPIEDSLFKPAN